MLKTWEHCPVCGEAMGTSRDMWGQFYVCEECGFTLEEEEPGLEAGSAPEPAVAA